MKEEADWLLQKVIKLYVSIRSFSVWMEFYKSEQKVHKQKCTTKKRVSIVILLFVLFVGKF